MNKEIMQRKLDLYERFFDEMKQIEEEEAKMCHKSMLEAQYKKNNEKIEENFIYLDEFRDLNELSMKEKKIINEQNNLHNYHELKTKVEKVKDVYSTGKYLMYFSRWVPFY